MIASVIPQQSCSRIDNQTCAKHNHHISLLNGIHCTLDHFFIQSFFIQDNIRPDDTAALVAIRNPFALGNIFCRETLAALCAIVAQRRAMQLPDMLTAGFLVQAINVLGDDAERSMSLS